MDITNILFSAYLAFGQPVPERPREVIRYGGIQAIHADGTLTLRLTETGREERRENGARHLVVTSRDEDYPFFLTRHFVRWDDCDVAETWVEIRHDEEGPVRLVRSDSFAATLPGVPETVDVLTLAGINQTIHTLTIRMTADFSIRTLGRAQTVTVSAEYPLEETIVVGDVPLIAANS